MMVVFIAPTGRTSREEIVRKASGKRHMEERFEKVAWDEIVQMQVKVRAWYRKRKTCYTDADDLAQAWAIEAFNIFRAAFHGASEEEARWYIRRTSGFRKISALRKETKWSRNKRKRRTVTTVQESEEMRLVHFVKAKTQAPDERAILNDELRAKFGWNTFSLIVHKLYSEGWKKNEIAEELGKSQTTIGDYFYGLGVAKNKYEKIRNLEKSERSTSYRTADESELHEVRQRDGRACENHGERLGHAVRW